jgi:hypothetical protein
MTTLAIDRFRRQIIVTGPFRVKRIDLVDVECVQLGRSLLADSLPNPLGVVIPVYEIALGVRGGHRVSAYGGTSLIELRRQAAELAGRLKVTLNEEVSLANLRISGKSTRSRGARATDAHGMPGVKKLSVK